MPPFEKRRNHQYRSLLAALIMLAFTLATGPTALAQTPQEPPSEAASEPGQAGASAKGDPVKARATFSKTASPT
jgi:hypothetical protein